MQEDLYNKHRENGIAQWVAGTFRGLASVARNHSGITVAIKYHPN